MSSADVDVDEKLFLEEVDDSEEESDGESVEDHTHIGGDMVTVDESLFDMDNLQDLNLDDPAILEPQS